MALLIANATHRARLVGVPVLTPLAALWGRRKKIPYRAPAGRTVVGSILRLWLGLFLAVPALAQPLDTFRVKLQVSADASIQAQVENALARALQRLEAVQITEETHHWLLHILVVALRPGMSYALSMVVLENTTIEFNRQAVYIPDLHSVYIDTNLSVLCARAIAAFDDSSLAAARAARRSQRP